MNGLMTEREWRKQAERARRPRSGPWGAQCVMTRRRENPLKRDRAFHLFLLFLACLWAALMPALFPKTTVDGQIVAVSASEAQTVSARHVPEIGYELPEGLSLTARTYTREQLLRGKLLLVDDAHPLPPDAPAPNTQGIAVYGRGMVPINDLRLQSGRETIDALVSLFAALRERNVKGFSVWRATMTEAQQRAERLSLARGYAAHMPLETALRQAMRETDAPGAGEMGQSYTVELRMSINGSGEPDTRPLEQTANGGALLQIAWRYGFIRRFPQGEGSKAFRFRYVGEAHATAMTYLNLTFEEYLAWLHEKGVVVVYHHNEPRYIILCQPMNGGYVQFSLPENASYDASLDNDGYAVVACALP